jgi:hypothetical protein
MRTKTATRSGIGETKGRGAVWTAAAILALLTVAGCTPDGSAAANAAQGFHRSWSDSNWSAACSVVQSDIQEKITREQGTICENHLRTLRIPEPGSVIRSEIYGRNALVEFENDTVFLAEGENGWQITGAGCASSGEAPYNCEVGGK